MPELTPADRILEATKQLKEAITQQPTTAPMEELQAIQLLREVMLGEHEGTLPANSLQREKARRKQQSSATPADPPPTSQRAPNYVSDDEDLTPSPVSIF